MKYLRNWWHLSLWFELEFDAFNLSLSLKVQDMEIRSDHDIMFHVSSLANYHIGDMVSWWSDKEETSWLIPLKHTPGTTWRQLNQAPSVLKLIILTLQKNVFRLTPLFRQTPLICNWFETCYVINMYMQKYWPSMQVEKKKAKK